MMEKLRSCRAFTVLELVATLVLVSVLAGVGYVSYNQFIATSEDRVDLAAITAGTREALSVGAVTVDTANTSLVPTKADWVASLASVGFTLDSSGESDPDVVTPHHFAVSNAQTVENGVGATAGEYRLAAARTANYKCVLSMIDSNGTQTSYLAASVQDASDECRYSTWNDTAEQTFRTENSVNDGLGGDSYFPSGAPSAPSVPTSGPATGPSNGQMGLAWDAPTGEVSQYEISWTPADGPTPATVPAPATAYTATGLTNGVVYTFSVAASGLQGQGAPLVLSGAPDASPGTAGTPTSTISSSVETDVDVAWTAPESDGGSPITGYNILVTTNGVVSSTFATGSATTATTFSGVLGSTYSFQVQAENDLDVAEAFSAPSNSTFVVTGPGTPDAPTAVAGIGEADITWLAPTTDGGSPVTDYVVEVSANSGASWTTVSDAVSAATSATVTGLTNGSTYVFRIAAANAYSTGSFSTQSANTFIAGPPSAPTGLAATGDIYSADLTWTAPYDGGSPITDYVVEYSTDNASWSTFADSTSTGTSTTVTGLTGGTYYYFRVSAVNVAAVGDPSTSAGATANLPLTSSGGTVLEYTSGGQTYRSHAFAEGTSQLSLSGVPAGFTVDVLIVAGGGGGGAYSQGGGGGGAGGLQAIPGLSVSNGNFTVVVGGGGVGGQWPDDAATSGSDSSIFGLTSVGGGFGHGSGNWGVKGDGGSGGGGSGFSPGPAPNPLVGGTGTTAQGFKGGNGASIFGSNFGAGGGGGAGAPGGYSNPTYNTAGSGGIGLANSYRTGSNVQYAGGGAGVQEGGVDGSGGSGGGGGAGGDGTDGLGGGGGGVATSGSSPTGGNGGAGLVVVRFVIP